MVLARQLVTQAFREGLRELYPGLDKEPSYWRFMSYLLFPSHVEEDTGNIVISAKTLSAIGGKEARKKYGRSVGKHVLEDFTQEAMPNFTHFDWSYAEGKARTTPSPLADPNLAQLLARLNEELVQEGVKLVFLDTGEPWSDKKREKENKMLVESRSGYATPRNQVILDYHEKLPTNRFTRMVNKRKQEVLDHLKAYERCHPDKAESNALTAAQFAMILTNPKPVIGPVENSERLFSLRPSLATIRSDVRKIFTQGWHEYDLRSAQLAIIATQWHVPELKVFLSDLKGESVWKRLASELGVDLEQTKKALKKGVYALVFGGGEKRIREVMLKEKSEGEVVDRFLAHSLVTTITRYRDERIDKIMGTGYTDPRTKRHVASPTWDDTASFIAQEAQRAELELLLPVYKLLKQNSDVTIMLYQFDGVTIHYRNAEAVRLWEPRVKRVVLDEARRMGIDTELVGGIVEAPQQPVSCEINRASGIKSGFPQVTQRQELRKP